MVKAVDEHFVYKFDKSNIVLIVFPLHDECFRGKWFEFICGKMIDIPGVERCLQSSMSFENKE